MVRPTWCLEDNSTSPNAVALTVGGDNADSVYSGVLSGAGSLEVAGGTLTLNAANTYSGDTTITGGTLVVANQNALADSAVVCDGGSLAFDSSVTGHAFTFGGLSGSTNVVL